ncbi:tRNA epoxyqueuosine(34) reductase QueG [Propionivibrio limicola]|uniref:tRNA epoxyqueuosine(34) reductase QueG n=1 Tax=Propionivibrio limicola TaxID=167645 RepID=UPI001291E30F|nr:tRNA epoxyqueuosine(34) reductase QueG [Propionivibrio limicola]
MQKTDSDCRNEQVADEIENFSALVKKIKEWGTELGFAEIGVSRADTSSATPRFLHWLELGRHGGMDYMAKHAALRTNPAELLPGTRSVISARLPYWPTAADSDKVLSEPALGYISRYALGRDYHKTVRNMLQKLADRIAEEVKNNASGTAFAYRVFSDSAPVMEVEFSTQAGIGWRGKHTLTLTRNGSFHFLGEIYISLPLPPDRPVEEHCGTCKRCIDACPTGAITAPYELDARRCISYLTIEWPGSIPPELRPLIGNRIYGCDDCQLHCPWNRFAEHGHDDFAVRHALDAPTLVSLFSWSETEFTERFAGSPIRRIGHARWLRNIAVALGNASATPDVVAALESRLDKEPDIVQEHILWALTNLDRNLPLAPHSVNTNFPA